MAKGSGGRLHRLTARQLQAAGEGKHDDGGGLQLRVFPDGARWVFRYTAPTGRRREMGLGPAERQSTAAAGESLTTARRLAHEARELIRQGVDPLDAREQQRDAARQADAAREAEHRREHWTLARSARDYHERVIEPTRTAKHGADWINSLENHIAPGLWNAPIDTITPPALLAALLEVGPHERARRHDGPAIPETLRRIRQRLDAIFEDAIFHKRATINAAAAIRRKLAETGKARKSRGRLAALPFKEAPALLQRIRGMEGTAARALEFAVLCAARTGEVLGAEWSEIDISTATWVIPAARMKAKEPHTVHLSPRALEVLQAVQGLDKRVVFPSMMPGRAGQPLSNMAMLAALDRLGARDRTTAHGLARATFSTWANETGAARPDVIEACLAHKEGDRVRAAYNRAAFADERRALLARWAEFLRGAEVIAFPAAKAS